MNHILTKRYITHNCIENCIANLCDFHQIDFRPLFLFSWDFGFKMTKSILENRIYSRSNFDINIDDYYKISKLYFNIEFIPTSNDIKKIMCLLTDGNIILINSNAYNLAWNSAYKKEYIPHSFLVAYDSFKAL